MRVRSESSFAVALALWAAAASATPTSLREAVEHHQNGRLDAALAAYREVAAEADPETASAAHNNACVLLHDRGEFRDAATECRAAVALRRTLGNDRLLAQSLNNLALALSGIGDRQPAESALREALELHLRLGIDEEVVINRANLAALAVDTGSYGRALDELAAAESIVDRHSDAPWATEQRPILRQNRAVVLERLGAFDDALAILDALAADPPDDPYEAALLQVNGGVVRRNLGDPQTARRQFEAALATFRELGDRSAVANAWLNLGLAQELDLGQRDAARASYLAALDAASAGDDVENQLHARIRLARLALGDGDSLAADDAAQEALTAARQAADGEAEWAALDALARTALARGERETAISRFEEAIAIVEALRERGGAARDRAAFLADKRELFVSAVELAASLATERPTSETRRRALAISERARARELADAAGLPSRSTSPDSLATIRDGPVRLLVFALGERHLWRFELGAGADALRAVGPVAEVLPAARRVHAELTAGDLSDELPRLAAHLFDGLVEPLPPRIALVADDVLRYLPFEAMPTPDGSPLVTRSDPFRLPSAAFLVGGSAVPPPVAPRLRFAGLAPTAESVADPRSQLGLLRSRFSLPPLPASADEVRAAARRLGGASETLIGEAATPDALEGTVGDGVAVLQLAAHTVLDERLTSGGAAILLAPSAGDDGLLLPERIARMHLQGALVVLSGCSTALGPTSEGRALGTLAGSFLAAGASGVVASLWDVRDGPTAELLDRFAAGLGRGQRPAQALAQAQRDLATAGTSPASWAAFVLIGDPEPVTAPVRAWPVAALAAAAAVLAGVAARRYRSAARATRSSSADERASSAPPSA